MQYIIGAVLTEELFNSFLVEITGFEMPVKFTETKLGYSGERSVFELYVPGMLVLAIIMMMFSASAAIVREPEIQTLKRLKLSHLSALEFLTGISLVQIIVAAISLLLALFTAIELGYEIIPGTLWFLILIAFLTSLSIISFSLLFAAFCRSIKDVAIIATFPMLIFMFFTGAAMPVKGATLFTIGNFEFTMAGILSPTHSINALNKVLLLGLPPANTIPDITALVVLTIVYFILGVWAFNRRHMKMA
jgi:ABC-2 type transport system permease protein